MKYRILTITSCIVCLVIFLISLTAWVSGPNPPDNKKIRQSVSKSLFLLQKSGYVFTNNNKFKCASCHHNTLTAMATELARLKGVPVIDSLEASNVTAMEHTIEMGCNPNHVTNFIQANFIIPYLLLGLHASHYPADLHTDISVDYLIGQAKPDGSFLTESIRVPLESGEIHMAAMSIRALQLYASAANQKRIDMMVSKTRQWFENQYTHQQQELAFQLLGLQWCNSDETHKKKIAAELTAMQNSDGGWSQLATLSSDAYATGQALYALFESGMAKPDDLVYQKGINYLLQTQDKTGAWIVATRSFPIQPFVDSQFPPYNSDQFISATATNWAVLALMNALPNKEVIK